jgi:hypothetical protein
LLTGLQFAVKLVVVLLLAATATGAESVGAGVGVGVGVNVAVAVGVGVGVGRGLGAAERLPSTIRPHAAAANHAIAVTRLIRGIKASIARLRWLAQITRRLKRFVSIFS